jgi:hypothetical protein
MVLERASRTGFRAKMGRFFKILARMGFVPSVLASFAAIANICLGGDERNTLVLGNLAAHLAGFSTLLGLVGQRFIISDEYHRALKELRRLEKEFGV